MTRTLDRWLPSLTLILWGAILIYFYSSGRLAAFLHPMFRPGVIVAGVFLIGLAIAAAFGGGAECCEEETCGHSFARMTTGKILTFAVLILPLVMTFRSTQDSFGLAAINNRGIIMDAATMGAGTLQNLEGYQPEEVDGKLSLSVIDLLYAANEPTLRSDFAGKTVEVIGQVMRETEANPYGNRMKLIRMFMSCCAADSRPVGAVMEFSSLPDIPELSWVKVVGVPTFPMEGGRNITVIKVQAIEATDPPEETMLY